MLTSARLLRLLSLLHGPRAWTGPELAERLGVTTRTVRNDVGRLRELGYAVHARPGVAGGYRLGVGPAVPPLLLDEDEAVAVAVGLRTAAGGTVAGIEESALRALRKLDQVLPSRLRHRVRGIAAATVALPPRGSAVAPDVLTTLAAACENRERLRFDYHDHDGAGTVRTVEPFRLVHTGRRWYLVAWDVDRADWRTFRVDRIEPRVPTGPRFAPRDPPDGDLAAYMARTLSAATWRYRARVAVQAPAEAVAEWLPPGVPVERAGPDACVVTVGSDTPQMLALHLGMLDAEFEVDAVRSPELADQLRALGARFQRAVAA